MKRQHANRSFRGGNRASLQIFLIISTCFLYLVSAGLFTRSVWLFEIQQWDKLVGSDAEEAGSGPGSYDIRQSVWHVNVSLKLVWLSNILPSDIAKVL
jgi:high-affinity iron transporter